MKQLTVLTWNVAHQIYERPIPANLGEALISLSPDVIFLTEFVDGPSRRGFRTQLRDAGYTHQAVTEAPPKHNRVFAASRTPFELGDIAPPSMGDVVADRFAESNFLHIRLKECDFELIGARTPLWKGSTINRAYRTELATVLRAAAAGRAVVVAGDINADPFKKVRNQTVRSVPFADAPMYNVHRPIGPWSYSNHDGSQRTRIDHVLHTPGVHVTDAQYVYEAAGIPLGGPKSVNPLSDHAALTFKVEPTVNLKRCRQ